MATPIQKTATAGEFVILRDTNNDILLMQGTTVPNAVAWYAKGATFLKTDVAAWTWATYLNKGTNLSCSFSLVTQA